MLKTGNQLKAARVLAGLNQNELAERAGVNVNTIRAMEARRKHVLASGLDTVAKVQRALESAGVTLIPSNRAGLGVRLTQPDD